jgi:hypothetical protein
MRVSLTLAICATRVLCAGQPVCVQVLGEEFKTYLPDLIPHMASVFSLTAEGYSRQTGDGGGALGGSGAAIPMAGMCWLAQCHARYAAEQ